MFKKVTIWAQEQADRLGKAINVSWQEPKSGDVDAQAERQETQQQISEMQGPSELVEDIDYARAAAADAADQAATKMGTVIDACICEAGDTADDVAAALNARLDTLGERAIRVVPVKGAVEAVREAEDHAEEAWTAVGRAWRRTRRRVAERVAAVAQAVHPGADDVRFFERDE
jgi:hypothetical protein